MNSSFKVVLGDIGVPVESPTREELKHVPDIADQEISKADTSGIYVIVDLLLHIWWGMPGFGINV